MKAKCNGSSVNHLPIDHPARAFRNVWEFIRVEEGFGSPVLIYDGTRIIIPPSARSRVLDLLHIPHAGQVKTKKATQQLYYCPGMNAAIHDRIAGCEVCTEALPVRTRGRDLPVSTSPTVFQHLLERTPPEYSEEERRRKREAVSPFPLFQHLSVFSPESHKKEKKKDIFLILLKIYLCPVLYSVSAYIRSLFS